MAVLSQAFYQKFFFIAKKIKNTTTRTREIYVTRAIVEQCTAEGVENAVKMNKFYLNYLYQECLQNSVVQMSVILRGCLSFGFHFLYMFLSKNDGEWSET